MPKSAEISVDRAEIVEKERKRIAELSAERGVRPEDVVVHERGGLTILFAARANGEALVVNYTGEEGAFRHEDGRLQANVNLHFKAPDLVSIVWQDGKVGVGPATDRRKVDPIIETILSRWVANDLVRWRKEAVAALIKQVEMEYPHQYIRDPSTGLFHKEIENGRE